MSIHLMQERRDYIEKRLMAEGSIKISELTRFFDVSSETIRKDLLFLEEKGVAKKAYGGAVSVSSAIEPSFKEKSITYLEEKTRIAAAALTHIASGMSLILDAGSTVFSLAKALAIKKDITVFTNGLKAAQVLDEYGISTHLLGGRIRHNSNSIVGSWALRNLREIRVDLAILGTSGFRDRSGPCVENFPEAELKRAMIDAGNKVLVLGDSSKAIRQPIIEFAKWKEIDALITDDGIGDDALRNIKEQTAVIVV
jgi:DeoR/GlpR family transcriptional regulator of sugar metabolism